jgi:hypothetical protein
VFDVESRRRPSPHVRVAPKMSMFAYGEWDAHYGELVQAIYETGAEQGIVVDFDADDHPRSGEVRAGASPLEAIRIIIEALGAFAGLWEFGEVILERVVPWIVKHRGESQELVSVEILGPDGEVIKSVLVDPGGGWREWPPRSSV